MGSDLKASVLTCFALLIYVGCAALIPLRSESAAFYNASSVSHPEGVDDAREFLVNPGVVIDGKAHHLQVGKCKNGDGLLHSETIIINNDGTSRVVGDIRVNVEGAVNITCFKLFDLAGNASGAFPRYHGGIGLNYIDLTFDAVYGYGLNFLIQLFGHDLKQNT